MRVHAISTGAVQITENWRQQEQGSFPVRLARTLLDRRMTEWLPIYVWVIEHPDGLIVIDTGIAADANRPIYVPPHMRLVQSAAPFRITAEEEIGYQMRQRELSPNDVRWVVLTHLHQDHDGGLKDFPQSDFIVSRTEYRAASGIIGRMSGYLNQRWPTHFHPTLIDFTEHSLGSFTQAYPLTQDITLVATPGHSAGHLAVVLRESEHVLLFAGDTAYSEALLLGRVCKLEPKQNGSES